MRYRLEVRITTADIGKRVTVRWRPPELDDTKLMTDVLGILEEAVPLPPCPIGSRQHLPPVLASTSPWPPLRMRRWLRRAAVPGRARSVLKER